MQSNPTHTEGASHLNKASSQLITEMKEIDIPMPYGKLTAKAWGHETSIPVLAIHGVGSDSCSFDKLIPLLNNKFYIVAIDRAGHGLSSQRPPGSLYTVMQDLLDYKRAVDFLGWEKFHILCHSFGCSVGYLFSITFPYLVIKMVAIDKIKPDSFPLSDFPESTSKYFNEVFDLEKNWLKAPKVYTCEYVRSLYHRIPDKVSEEGLDVLLKRKIRTSDCGTGVVINTDVRCRVLSKLNMLSNELLYRYLSGVKCELLLILANSAHPLFQTDCPDAKEEVLDIYRRNAKKFILKYVEGNHFVILDNPERLTPLINEFLYD